MAQPNQLNPKFAVVDSLHGNGVSITCVSTNATTPVILFGNPSVFSGTITGCFLIAKGGTAANITLKSGNAASTVCTIAKGTSTGALVGASSLSNTTISGSATIQIVSSGANTEADAYVFVTYKSA